MNEDLQKFIIIIKKVIYMTGSTRGIESGGTWGFNSGNGWGFDSGNAWG